MLAQFGNPPEPGAGLFQLSGELVKQTLLTVAAGKHHAHGQAIGCLVQGH